MDLDEIRAFLAVVDSGSFNAAADAVNQPRTTLRRRVKALEERAGASLIERSRDGIAPTLAGERVAKRGRQMLHDAEAMFSELRGMGGTPAGDVRVGVPAGIPARILEECFEWFGEQLPDLHFHVHVSDEPITELLEHVDVAVHFGAGSPTGRFSSWPLVRMREGLRASRSYIERHGMPQTVDDLRGHRLLAWRGPHDESKRWPLEGGGAITVEPAFTTSNHDLLRRLAVRGMGIALLPDVNLSNLVIDDDQLVPVLEEVVGHTHHLRMVMSSSLAGTPKYESLLLGMERFKQLRSERLAPTVQLPSGSVSAVTPPAPMPPRPTVWAASEGSHSPA